MWFKELGVYLDEVYGTKGSKKYKVVKKELPKLLCQIVSFFDKELAVIMPSWGIKDNFKIPRPKIFSKLTSFQPSNLFRKWQ